MNRAGGVHLDPVLQHALAIDHSAFEHLAAVVGHVDDARHLHAAVDLELGLHRQVGLARGARLRLAVIEQAVEAAPVPVAGDRRCVNVVVPLLVRDDRLPSRGGVGSLDQGDREGQEGDTGQHTCRPFQVVGTTGATAEG